MRRSAAVGLLVVSLLVPACATRRWAGEPALRQAALQEQSALLARVRSWDDPTVAAYLAGLAERLTGTRPTFHVLRDPTLALFAMPTGDVVVHTGLLAAAGSEAELALVLAHELAHLARNHALEAGEPDSVAPRLGGQALTSPTAAAIFGLRLPLTARAAMVGYGGRREREGDAAALTALVRGGWDPTAVPVIYERLAEQAREAGAREVFVFGDRRRLAARHRATVARLASGVGVVGASAAPRSAGASFASVWGAVVRENAAEEMRLGRFDLARRGLEQAGRLTPEDPRVHLYRGELHRLQAQRGDTGAERDIERVRAREAYERALEMDGALADAHRGLGLLHYAAGDVRRARAELERYLTLAPGGPDRARVAEYVEALR